MPTVDELFAKFASPSGDRAPTTTNHAVVDGNTKIASEGENKMHSLTDIYMSLTGMDHEKTAAAAAQTGAPAGEPTDDVGDVDFAAMAEKLAAAEAAEQVQSGTDEETDFLKIAAEYDSAGRIMARGFYDEFMKLAGNMTAADNQNTETASAAKTPALGERGLPTLETNYAGTVDTGTPGKQPSMNGTDPKNTYKDSLKTSKTISAGVTGDDPEGAALGLGGGSPIGFATVRDLKA